MDSLMEDSVSHTLTYLWWCATESRPTATYCVLLFVFLHYLEMQCVHSAASSFPALPPSLCHSCVSHTQPLPSVHATCVSMKTTSSVELITLKLDIWCRRLLYLYTYIIHKDIDLRSFKIIPSYSLCMEYYSSVPEEGNDPCWMLLYSFFVGLKVIRLSERTESTSENIWLIKF